LLNSSPYYA
jgi:hypothetical protein